MATTKDKILNSTFMYNETLKEQLDARFVKRTEFDTDTFVTKVAGKDLSSNDFTDELKAKLNSVDTDTYVTKIEGKGLSTNDFTDEYKTKINGIEETYAKKSDVASVLKYKGTVADFDAIPSDTSVGDVWNISVGGGVDEHGVEIKDGDNVAITETGADVLAGSIDMSGFAKIYIGAVQPTDTSVIWFDTSAD